MTNVSPSPLVTIMIPTRDRPRDLMLLLASLQRSGHLPNWETEVLIIDNNSEGSRESLAVRLIAHEFDARLFAGAGPKSSSLNHAAELARGEILVFLDDDTTVNDPHWLNELVGGLEPGVGYVAGNVKARQTDTRARQLWEAKGGLSKGTHAVELNPPTSRNTSHAWRLKRVAAGATCAIPRRLFFQIGGFSERLGAGTPVQGGETLEIVDRVLRSGYRARYIPTAHVAHEHPPSERALHAKLRGYARGDTAMALHLAITHCDLLALAWAIAGHQLYRVRNLGLAILGRYPLTPRCAWASCLGSLEGLPLYLFTWLRSQSRRKAKGRHYEFSA